MARWPRTVGGNLLAFVCIVIVGLVVVQSAIALSGGYVWIALGVTAVVAIPLILWRRATMNARDLAVADAPSFSEVLDRRKAREGLEP